MAGRVWLCHLYSAATNQAWSVLFLLLREDVNTLVFSHHPASDSWWCWEEKDSSPNFPGAEWSPVVTFPSVIYITRSCISLKGNSRLEGTWAGTAAISGKDEASLMHLPGAKHHPSSESSGPCSTFSPGPRSSLILDFQYVAFLDSGFLPIHLSTHSEARVLPSVLLVGWAGPLFMSSWRKGLDAILFGGFPWKQNLGKNKDMEGINQVAW